MELLVLLVECLQLGKRIAEVLLTLDKEQANGLGEFEVVVDADQAGFEGGSGLADGLEARQRVLGLLGFRHHGARGIEGVSLQVWPGKK